MIILMVRMIILMGQDDGFPNPPHPKPQMAFSEIYWAFPVTGRSQLLGVPMAWRQRRQAMAKWRWGRRKWRWAPQVRVRATLGWGGVGWGSHHPDPLGWSS